MSEFKIDKLVAEHLINLAELGVDDVQEWRGLDIDDATKIVRRYLIIALGIDIVASE